MLKTNSNSIMKPVKGIFYGVIILVTVILVSMSIGINTAGYRTVVQWPNGTTFVKFDPGWYFQLFGNTWEYRDVLTIDFNKTENEEGATIDLAGIAVRYQDGGLGTIYGIARFRLPSDEETMLKVHKEFRSDIGVGVKLLQPVVESALNQTAGLMSSEASYAEKRSTFVEWANDQIVKGPYKTRQEKTYEVEYGFEFCLESGLTEKLQEECKNVKKVTKWYPTILYANNEPQYSDSDLKEYGVAKTGFKVVDWGYEPKTLEQISTKREATMAIITAKANAERAKQDAITAEQQGLANVTVAKYEQEVEKERQIVMAEREKEKAVIKAKQQVEVAEQQKLEQEQLKLAAGEYKQAQTLKGQGDAAYKKAVIEADGALQQKLDTYTTVMINAVKEFGKQKWVPEIVMGSSASGVENSSAAMDMISMLGVKVAKDLELDMSVRK